MKPIPTIEEITETYLQQMGVERRTAKQLEFSRLLTAPLYAAIQERDAEIERLRGLMAEAFHVVEKIESDQYVSLHIKRRASAALDNLSQAKRSISSEPEPAKPDPYAHLREAEAQGKVIQCNYGTPEQPKWKSVRDLTYDQPPEFYRVKPWTLPPPPEGKQWHRVDGWTEEMLPEGLRPLLLGEKRQKGDEYQYQGDTVWGPCQVFAEPSTMSDEFYRTLRPLPEPEVWVDLGPEDCPPGSVFRLSDKPTRHWSNCSYVTKEGARFSEDFISFEDMNKECFQINRSIPLAGKWDLNAWELCRKLFK